MNAVLIIRPPYYIPIGLLFVSAKPECLCSIDHHTMGIVSEKYNTRVWINILANHLSSYVPRRNKQQAKYLLVLVYL